MKKIFLSFLLISFVLASFTSCTTTHYFTDYKITVNTQDTSKHTDDLSYTDSLLSIKWHPSAEGFNFNLTNTSSSSLKIIWDDATFVGFDGNSSKIMHQGIKYIDRNNAMSPTTIITGSSLNDIVTPTNNVYWVDGTYSKYGSTPGRWEMRDIYETSSSDSLRLQEYINSYSKSNMKILLPIKYKDTVYEYVFIFKIKEATPIIPMKVQDATNTAILGASVGTLAGILLAIILISSM